MLEKIKEYKEIIFNLIKLSLPIFGGNVSQILVSFADSAVAGRYSTLALGAISVASAIVMTVTIGAIGLILSVSPVIANMRGKKQPSKKYFKLTLLFSLLVSIPFFFITELFAYKIDVLGLDEQMVPYVKQYIEICAWSVFPTAIFVAIKEFLQAWEKVVFANILMLFMVVINVVLNIVLTFGFDFGSFEISAMGVKGLSIATLASKTLVAILILAYCIPLLKVPFINSKTYLKDLFKMGTPISFALFFEFLGFNLTAVLIGKFSALFAGVHNIILCVANCAFMTALSISNASSIKIGFYNGKQDKTNIIKYSLATVFLIMAVCSIFFVLMNLYPEKIIGIFSNDPEVIKLGTKLMIFVIAFLFFDALQCACVGILKGLKDTKIIMITMLCAYLLVAIPLGSYFAFKKGIILEGYWGSLVLAIFLVAVITSSKVVLNIKK